MGALARFEAFVESLFEGPFARLLGGGVQPVAIAKQIERTMEDHRQIGPAKVFVPNRFQVGLNPGDFEQLAPAAPALAHEMEVFAVRLAQERGYSFLGTVTVELGVNEATARGHVRVFGESVATLETPHRVPRPAVPAVEQTQAIDLSRLRAEVPTAPAALEIARSGESRLLPVEHDTLTIGRALDNDLVVEDPAASRHHAEIRRQQGHYYLADLQSTNGTFVNGRRVAGSFLQDGDLIRIGEVEFTFRLDGGHEA